MEEKCWASHHHGNVVVDHPQGTFKRYCSPCDPRDRKYAVKGIVYPTNKGGLPGYTGEDDRALDGFVGEKAYGMNGMLVVDRPDTWFERETKFFFGYTEEELERMIDVFKPIINGYVTVFATEEELEDTLERFRDDRDALKWLSPYYDQVVVEQKIGSYKSFAPLGKKFLNYVLDGITYPVAYGCLPGYMGEDEDTLDAFVGATINKGYGENGWIGVWRPDIDGQLETKFYFGLSRLEKDRIVAAYGDALLIGPRPFKSPEELDAGLVSFRATHVAV